MSTTMLALRISKELKEAVEKEAEADCRTMTQVAKLALITYLKNKGRLPSTKRPSLD